MKFEDYFKVNYKIPERMLAWELYGTGFDNFGKDDKPFWTKIPYIDPDQLLVRIDAVGLCFSDVKIIKSGEKHPRLLGRNLSKDPVIPGHEVSITVVKVGDNLKEKFRIGDRFIIQANIFYKGKNLAYGYRIKGGYAQYSVMGKEILQGDEGCYLIPLKEEIGYAEAALIEPWTCVEASFNIPYRKKLKPKGISFLINFDKNLIFEKTSFHKIIDSENPPQKIIIFSEDKYFLEKVRNFVEKYEIKFIVLEDRTDIEGINLENIFGEETNQYGFDDIVLINPGSEKIIYEISKYLSKRGILNIINTFNNKGKIPIDIGRIHYDGIKYVGNDSYNLDKSYRINTRSEIKQNGIIWILGAGGPMGHMHVQRAIFKKYPPKKIVATNRQSDRIWSLQKRFRDVARSRKIDFVCYRQKDFSKKQFSETLKKEVNYRGFDDIIVLALSTEAVEYAFNFIAEGGVINIFGGIPKGNIVRILSKKLCSEKIRVIGSSGSNILDIKKMLTKVEEKKINTNNSVFVIGGMNGLKKALIGVSKGEFPGKVIIFPQIENLNLTRVDKIQKKIPIIQKKLEDGSIWTKEAEVILFEKYIRFR